MAFERAVVVWSAVGPMAFERAVAVGSVELMILLWSGGELPWPDNQDVHEPSTGTKSRDILIHMIKKAVATIIPLPRAP